MSLDVSDALAVTPVPGDTIIDDGIDASISYEYNGFETAGATKLNNAFASFASLMGWEERVRSVPHAGAVTTMHEVVATAENERILLAVAEQLRAIHALLRRAIRG